MADWKLPPKSKVYEAFSAVADGRVEILVGCEAKVTSSGGDKSYKVSWSEDLSAFASNDNASVWQGYAGYPILAVMMVLGALPVDAAVLAPLKGVPWNDLNKKFKRDYDAAVSSVLSELDPAERLSIEQAVDDVYSRLSVQMPEKLGRS